MKRSSWAAWATVAALLVSVTACTSGGHDGTASSGLPSIAKADWLDLTYPTGTCGSTGPTVLQAIGDPLRSVTYGDLAGDAAEEAVVVLDCDRGNGTDPYTQLIVFTGSPSFPRKVASAGAECDHLDLACHPRLTDWVRITQRHIETQVQLYQPGDETCCPSTNVDAILEPKGDELVQTWAGMARERLRYLNPVSAERAARAFVRGVAEGWDVTTYAADDNALRITVAAFKGLSFADVRWTPAIATPEAGVWQIVAQTTATDGGQPKAIELRFSSYTTPVIRSIAEVPLADPATLRP